MRTIRHHILVQISEAERRSMFEKPITKDNGEVVFLVTGMTAEAGTDASYAQGMSVGRVVCVGAEVYDINVGDQVLLDYIVDLTEEITLYKNEDEKLVRLDTRTIYREKDKIVPTKNGPRAVWKKGELDKASLVIAVVSEDRLRARWPYLLLEHVERDMEFKREEGSKFFTLEEEEKGTVERLVISSSDPDFPEGASILCENDALFERQLNGKMFDVVFVTDVFAVEEK